MGLKSINKKITVLNYGVTYFQFMRFIFQGVLFTLILITVSCNSNRLYHRVIKVPETVWNNGDRYRFVIPINKETERTNLHLFLRYASAFQYSEFEVKYLIYAPDKSLVAEETSKLSIRTQEGELTGDGLGNIWDKEFTLLENTDIFNQPGKYTFEISHLMPEAQVFFISEIGISLYRAE